MNIAALRDAVRHVCDRRKQAADSRNHRPNRGRAAQGAAGECQPAAAIQRPSDRARAGIPREGLRAVVRGNRLQARRRTLRARQSRSVGQGEVPEPGRVRNRRLDRPGGLTTVAWGTPAGILRAKWPASIRRPPGGGISNVELGRLWQRLQPLAPPDMPLDVPPPRTSRFGSPLVLSRVHWVRPELVVEVKYLSWTDDNLLRQVIYQGLREDKPPTEVRRPVPHRTSTAPEVRSATARRRVT